MNDKEAESIAQRYIDINRDDDLWKDNNPRLWEVTSLYMEKTIPSYMEYSVICDRNPECWYIIVNVDGDDVDIPIASPSDSAPSKILTSKSWDKKENLHFFYFWPFDIYSKNTITGQVNTINPQDDFMIDDAEFEKMNEHEKELIQKEQKEFLDIKLQGHISYWEEYRNSDALKHVKEYIHTYNIVPFGNPGTEDKNGWRYVKWQSAWSTCNSRIPCYEQFEYDYETWYTNKCASGCSPVAAAMIFAYHDKENNYPNLFQDTVAPMKNKKTYPWPWDPDINPRTVIDEIRWHMHTTCSISFRYPNKPRWGSTYGYDMPNGIQYAKDNGYPWSTSWLITSQSQILPRIEQEINNGRPLLINIVTRRWDWAAQPDINPLDTNRKNSWHTVVWYGYNKNSNATIPNQVRINAGWGNGLHSNSNISLFNITNIDLSDPAYSSWVYPTITESVVWYIINQ